MLTCQNFSRIPCDDQFLLVLCLFCTKSKSKYALGFLTCQALLENPEKYMNQPMCTTTLPIIVPNCFVLGPPKAGKSSCAKQLEKDLGVVRLTMSKVLRKIIQTKTQLGRYIKKQLVLGLAVSDEVLVQALGYVLQLQECVCNG